MSKTVRIHQPPKSAMQSGRGNSRQWVMEFEPDRAQRNDALMGWVGQGDTDNQVRLYFPTKAEAIAHARRNGWTPRVMDPSPRRRRPKAYADNFAYDKVT
ncbi:ETC complex I subunit [Roseospira navarrensis]|uniref:Oxidoreductase n=1 Tax=Roseospira navarrensis TaxID=140058 RepID=A0A7X2D663_9PROT|nr:ETC complex I subunit [Roseospira navarrensis]MQX37975.1 oxidoreductase [Roseospira navarrensis]